MREVQINAVPFCSRAGSGFLLLCLCEGSELPACPGTGWPRQRAARDPNHGSLGAQAAPGCVSLRFLSLRARCSHIEKGTAGWLALTSFLHMPRAASAGGLLPRKAPTRSPAWRGGCDRGSEGCSNLAPCFGLPPPSAVGNEPPSTPLIFGCNGGCRRGTCSCLQPVGRGAGSWQHPGGRQGRSHGVCSAQPQLRLLFACS